MATTRATAKSGNPATSAAAKKAEREAKAAELAERKAAQDRVAEEFKNLVLPEPVLDEDGYEVIPDRSALEGGSYKFKLGGQAFVLPNLQYLPLDIAMKLGKVSETEAHALIFDRYAPGVFAHASADQLMHVIKRWKDHSQGVGLGE